MKVNSALTLHFSGVYHVHSQVSILCSIEKTLIHRHNT